MAIVRGQEGNCAWSGRPVQSASLPTSPLHPADPSSALGTALKMGPRSQSSHSMLWAVRKSPRPRHRVLCAVLGVRRECRVQADHDAFQSVYRPGMPGVPALSDSNCTTTTLDRLHGLHSDFVVPREPPCTCPCTCTCTRTCPVVAWRTTKSMSASAPGCIKAHGCCSAVV